ncbi:hypothetical protein pb186bvf_017807 [Paramecium bursaria]
MYDNDHKIQREIADEIREKESLLKQEVDKLNQPKFLRVAIEINQTIMVARLRQYEDHTIESISIIILQGLIIGNDLPNSNQQINNEMNNEIRELLNYRNKFQRCHINLKGAATIAMIFQIQYKSYHVIKSLTEKYGLNKGHFKCIEEKLDLMNFMKEQLIVTSLVKSSQRLFYIDQKNERQQISFGQTANIFQTISHFEYNLADGQKYHIKFNLDIDQDLE